MPKGRVVLVVGHESWGKSWTLRALTGGRLTRSATFGPSRFAVRRMSNDDDLAGLLWFFCDLRHSGQARAIAPLCPKLVLPDTSAVALLAMLQPYYDLLFWVQEQAWDGRIIPAAEVAAMQTYGTVHVFRGHAAAGQRAADLRAFVVAHA